jgi:hypothetical protein
MIPEFILDIAERLMHTDTMRYPTPIEMQWYNDYNQHFAERARIEGEK